MAEAHHGLVGRPTKFNRERAARFLKKATDPVPVTEDVLDERGRKTGTIQVGTRWATNGEASVEAGWTEAALYTYLAIARRCKAGEDHPQAARFIEFLESYEQVAAMREESSIEAARKVIAEDLASRRVRVSTKTTAITSVGLSPLQQLVTALEGEPIQTVAQLYPQRGIGRAFLDARDIAQRGERIVKVERKVEPQLPSLGLAKWKADRTIYRKQAAETAGSGVDFEADPEEMLPRLRMLMAGDETFRGEVRAMIAELDAET